MRHLTLGLSAYRLDRVTHTCDPNALRPEQPVCRLLPRPPQSARCAPFSGERLPELLETGTDSWSVKIRLDAVRLASRPSKMNFCD